MDIYQNPANHCFLLHINVILRSPSTTPYVNHVNQTEYTECRNDLPIICRIIFVCDDLNDKLFRAPRLCKHRGNSIVIMWREIRQGSTLQSRAERALELTKMLTRADVPKRFRIGIHLERLRIWRFLHSDILALHWLYGVKMETSRTHKADMVECKTCLWTRVQESLLAFKKRWNFANFADYGLNWLWR